MRRLSLIFLVCVCWTSAPPIGRVLPDRAETRGPSVRAASLRTAILAPAVAWPQSLTAFCPWRYRLKSVLPDGDTHAIRETDLGPAPVAERRVSVLAYLIPSEPFRAIVPLRC